MKRYISESIKEDLNKKMVFLSGPRQVGKTTLAKSIITDESSYLNWDIDTNRASILKRDLPKKDELIFDELHRYQDWRALLKGLYDEYGSSKKIIVTGSTRLDFYRYGGDTLQGRYNFMRLHPLSVKELGIKDHEGLLKLLNLGGFPEPYFSNDPRQARRWSESYRSRLIEEEITKVEHLKNLSKLELLMLRLPDLVGSPLSLNSLREDLEVSHDSVASWMNILERFYAIYRISPFGIPNIKAIKKSQKHYHYDWTLIENPGLRFENFIASHLLKWIDYQLDIEGYRWELRYYHDSEDREVDFLLCKNGIPKHLIECKLNKETSHAGIKYLKQRLEKRLEQKSEKLKASIVCLNSDSHTINQEGIESVPALNFLQEFV